ncbi:transcriptional regulator [Skermanella pratensis]|uniref:transcriptional regulator n=1 Tax=Skermanella pratensis TaxID=2233999 RepID=UPI0013010F7D|nr:transcriptional regulator [Skermanella pratensis]
MARPEEWRHADRTAGRLAQGLGWFSLALGLAQVAAPAGMARLVGVPDEEENRNAMRALGLREIASGLGILATRHPARADWVWARVGGDAIDLALLGRAWASDRSGKQRVAAATAAVAGVMALDLLCGRRLDGWEGGAP